MNSMEGCMFFTWKPSLLAFRIAKLAIAFPLSMRCFCRFTPKGSSLPNFSQYLINNSVSTKHYPCIRNVHRWHTPFVAIHSSAFQYPEAVANFGSHIQHCTTVHPQSTTPTHNPKTQSPNNSTFSCKAHPQHRRNLSPSTTSNNDDSSRHICGRRHRLFMYGSRRRCRFY